MLDVGRSTFAFKTMPLTCSHPAAILPFKRFTPNPLNFAALVIGSMTPDVGYFIGERHLAKLAHLPLGTIFICLPTGFILLGLFYLVRRDLCFILPAPHRNQLTPLGQQRPRFTFEFLLMAMIAILIGAWTHIVWDQFTHDGSFVARHFSPLRHVLFYIGSQDITVSYVLQYVSTLVGAGILGLYYFKWLRTQPPRPDNQSDAWRYLLWFGLAVVALIVGAAIAIHLSAPVHEFRTFREFVYKMGVSAVSVFSVLIVISAILCYRRALGLGRL